MPEVECNGGPLDGSIVDTPLGDDGQLPFAFAVTVVDFRPAQHDHGPCAEGQVVHQAIYVRAEDDRGPFRTLSGHIRFDWRTR